MRVRKREKKKDKNTEKGNRWNARPSGMMPNAANLCCRHAILSDYHTPFVLVCCSPRDLVGRHRTADLPPCAQDLSPPHRQPWHLRIKNRTASDETLPPCTFWSFIPCRLCGNVFAQEGVCVCLAVPFRPPSAVL